MLIVINSIQKQTFYNGGTTPPPFDWTSIPPSCPGLVFKAGSDYTLGIHAGELSINVAEVMLSSWQDSNQLPSSLKTR